MAAERESINMKVPAELRRQVREYAARYGISVNAAATQLIVKGLEAERQRDGGK